MRRALAALVLAVALPLPGLADLVVQPGETLSEIAERNGVGLQQLMRANGIENPKLVQAGQRLVLPGGATAPSGSSRSGRANGGSTPGTVVVQPGETLSEIAERNGVGLQQLMRANGIENPKLVQAGQRLLLPGGATATASGRRGSRDAGAAAPGASGRSFSYSVKEGETLSEIAERYDTTVNQLMQRNRIGDPSQLQAGSKVFIPGTQVTAANSGTSRAATAKPAEQAYNPKAKEHVVQSGESLSQIAEGYKMPLDKLVVINNISNRNLVLSGTRLKLTAPPPVTPAKPSNPVKSTGSASQVAAKPAPAKPAAPKTSAKPTTAASAAQSFPAAPTNKLRITPNPGATSPVVGQGQTSLPTSSPVITNTAGSAISGKPTTAKASQVPITAAGQSAAKTATATTNTITNTTTTTNTNTTATATSTRPAAKATIALTAAATTAASMASSGAGPGNSANPKPEKSSPITANPAASSSSTASGSALNSSTLNSAARNSAAMNGATPNNSTANTAAANASARGAAGKVSGQSAATATTAKIATTDSGAATAVTGAASSRALGGSKPLDSAKTAKTIAPDWRTYGPISVDWANWQSMGGSYVAPSLNGEGQPLYMAINCGARKLNSTSQSGQWKTWEGPRSDAEQQLLNDLCKAKGS